MKIQGISTHFLWLPAHFVVEGKDIVYILAKQTLRMKHVDLLVPLSRAETTTFIRTYAQSVWQEYSADNETGRHP